MPNYFLEYTRLEIPEFRDTLIQSMDYVKKFIDKRVMHKMEYDSRANERQIQTTEEKIDTSNSNGMNWDAITLSRESKDKNNILSKPESITNERYQNTDQCYDTRPFPAKLTDNTTTEHSNQLLEFENFKPRSSSNVQLTFKQRSSSLVLHQITSDHNRSELGIQDHSNEPAFSKLFPKLFLYSSQVYCIHHYNKIKSGELPIPPSHSNADDNM
ncbi:hypothetical protein Tco_1504056 [Tanacetum coccineum]